MTMADPNKNKVLRALAAGGATRARDGRPELKLTADERARAAVRRAATEPQPADEATPTSSPDA